MKGEIKSLAVDFKTRKPEITLAVDASPASLEKYVGKPLSVEIKPYRKRRSPEANAYSWVLTQKIAEAVGRSTAWVHNDMLRKYGQLEIVNGQAVYVVLPDTELAAAQVDASESYHLLPTSQVRPGRGGMMYRTYMMIRGSHGYDAKEMSAFINGIVSEAKGLGIDTASPNEIKEMMERYGIKHNGDS